MVVARRQEIPRFWDVNGNAIRVMLLVWLRGCEWCVVKYVCSLLTYQQCDPSHEEDIQKLTRKAYGCIYRTVDITRSPSCACCSHFNTAIPNRYSLLNRVINLTSVTGFRLYTFGLLTLSLWYLDTSLLFAVCLKNTPIPPDPGGLCLD